MLPKIAHPIFEVEIPSTKKKVKMRPMLVREEKILLMAKASGEFADMFSSVSQIVNNTVVADNFDVTKLTIFDLEYLFVKLRAQSVNNIAKVSYRDGNDDQVRDFSVDLNKVEMKWPETEPNKIVPINDQFSILLKYPAASLYSSKDFLENKDENLDVILISMIDKIVNGDQMVQPELESKENIKEFVNELPISTYNAIKDFWASMPTLFYEISYRNTKDEERKIVLSSLQDFFTFV